MMKKKDIKSFFNVIRATDSRDSLVDAIIFYKMESDQLF